MKTLLNFLSNLLIGLMKLLNFIGSLSIALTFPAVLVCIILASIGGFEKVVVYTISFITVLFGIAVLLPEDGEDN